MFLAAVKDHHPEKRLSEIQSFLKSKRSRQVYRTGLDNSDNNIECSVTPPASKEHDYEVDTAGSCARLLPSITCQKCKEKNTTILELKQELAEEKNKLKDAMKKIEELQDANKRKNRFSIQEVKDSNRLVKFYTGLLNHGVFMWIYNRIQKKAKKLQYFRGDSSFTSKNYQTSENKKKSGKNPSLSIENCLFLTLIRLRVGLTETDLAFRFQVSQSLISRILATWISFLSQELSPLIYWPKKEDVLRYYPKCFKGYKNVIGIIDCTEGILEKPSIAKAQSQTYSAYKSRNTWKKLLCITPAGTISFISKSYGGAASDRYITETCGIVEKFQFGDNLMADKGFNISDLLVSKGSRLIIPPFMRDKNKFSKKNCKATSNVAKARIHVERAIARAKDFRIFNGAFPIILKDQLDDIFTICCALTNLGPTLVPL